MKTVILDSVPHISMTVHDTASHFYKIKNKKSRGQPLLGRKMEGISQFVSLNDNSDHIKELLTLPETQDCEEKAEEGMKEILASEKREKMPPPAIKEDVDQSFKAAANEFLKKPAEVKMNYDDDKEEEVPPIKINNDADLASTIAVTQKPKKRKMKKITKKKAPPKPTKVKKPTKFRVIKHK